MNSNYEFYIFFFIFVSGIKTLDIIQVINETNRLHTNMFMCIIEQWLLYPLFLQPESSEKCDSFLIFLNEKMESNLIAYNKNNINPSTLVCMHIVFLYSLMQVFTDHL